MRKTSPNGFAQVVPERDAFGLTADEFLSQLFEYEFCNECGKDSKDHTAVIGPMGHWFAYCSTAEAEGEAFADAFYLNLGGR